MRRRVDAGEVRVTELAKEKGTTRQTIHAVLTRPERPTPPGPVPAKQPRAKKEKPVPPKVSLEDFNEWVLSLMKEAQRARRLENELAIRIEEIRAKNQTIETLRGELTLKDKKLDAYRSFDILMRQGDIPSPLGVEERR